MKNICVFCGSSKGNLSVYEEEAKHFGKLIGEKGKTLIYGGGNVGLMGLIADTVLEYGGEVIGVIPDFLMKKEVGHLALSELIIVKSMHERKKRMAELADSFVAMPGGFGTLEELAEVSTWVQLELIKKPIAVLNVQGFYDHYFRQLDVMVEHGFLLQQNRNMIMDISSVESIIDRLSHHRFDDFSIWDELKKT